MLKNLVKVANRLDSLGLTKEADVVDRFILKMAEMEEAVEPEMGDASSIVRDAIQRSIGMPHFENAFRTRNPSPESEGSTFLEAQSAESLMEAQWEPYDHPDVKSPAIAYRADIPGYFGILELKDLDPSTPAQIVKAHKGAVEEAACIIPSSDVQRPKADFTTILLGPGGSDLIVWTFFPGPPIAPSSMPWSEEMAENVSTVGDAMEYGFNYGKLGGS